MAATQFQSRTYGLPMQQRMSFHLPIAVKAMVFIGALGVLLGAANWFCLRSLHEIDRISARVTERVEPARLILTEAQIAVESFGSPPTRWPAPTIPTPCARQPTNWPANMRRPRPGSRSLSTISPAIGRCRRHVAQARFGQCDREFRAQMAVAGDRERARATLELSSTPHWVDATTSMNRLIDILGGENEITMEAAADGKASTYDLPAGRAAGRHDRYLVPGDVSVAPFGGSPATAACRRHVSDCAGPVRRADRRPQA